MRSATFALSPSYYKTLHYFTRIELRKKQFYHKLGRNQSFVLANPLKIYSVVCSMKQTARHEFIGFRRAEIENILATNNNANKFSYQISNCEMLFFRVSFSIPNETKT